MDKVVYDLESYPNVFTMSVCFENGKGMRTFEISDRKNDLEDMLNFLRNVKNKGFKMVGFNNLEYDYTILHHILDGSRKARLSNKKYKITAEEIYSVSQNHFKSEAKFKGVRETDHFIPQIDLFKIHHFDNKARMTSLKILEVRMLSDNVEDLPFDINSQLNSEEIDILIKYNQHDVKETLKFLNESREAVEFREKLSQSYGFDCTNFNDTKIGKQYFINQLEKLIPGSCYSINGNRKQVRQTKREVIDVDKILFKYLKYERPEFKALIEWFRKQKITATKGVFSDIPEHELGELAKYCELKTKRVKLSDPNDPKNKLYIPSEEEINILREKNPMGWVDEKELKSPKGAKSYYWNYNIAETLNVVVDGLTYYYGTGGIHGCVSSSIISSDEEYIIVDADVSSMYPNLAISNRVYPEHLSDKFCDIYEDVYNTRKKYSKGSPENAVMKLALNGVYGDSNNEFSPFYDPQYTMTITINGQLTISMLVDMLLKIDGLKVVMANTDGITVLCPRDKKSEYDSICKAWEKSVKLDLEFVEYKTLYQRDVNNYIWEGFDGKLKRKGAYEYEGLGWHQDQSALVIKKAVEHELLGRGSAETFINKHDNKYDFLLATKVPRSSRLILKMDDGKIIPLQNITRYYPSTKGGKLVKVMPPLKDGGPEREIGIDVDYNVKVCNNILDFEWDLDYNYYINEARKLIDVIKKGE